MGVRVPRIASVEKAVEIYLSKPYLGNAELRELFGKIGSTTCVKLKDMARCVMEERGLMTYNATTVNTKAAYDAWGLDIAELKKNYRELQKYGFLGDMS